MNKLIQVFSKLAGVDEKSAQFIVNALSKNNLPGFDYLEFKQSLDALESLNIDEKTAFQSAFATATTMGLTKDKLLETTNYYKKVLEKEQNKFEQALQQQTSLKVSGKQKEIEKLQDAMMQKAQKIKALQEQIDRHQVEIEEAQKEIQTAKEKIFSAKESFEVTYDLISSELDSDIEKIKNYIQ